MGLLTFGPLEHSLWYRIEGSGWMCRISYEVKDRIESAS